MRIISTLLILLAFCSSALADGPKEVLDQYFKVLTSRNSAPLPSLMSSEDMKQMKVMMDSALTRNTRASLQLREDIFGKAVDKKTIEAATPEFYFKKLSSGILQAADAQKFILDDRTILGRIDETADMVHFVVRLHMRQHSMENSSLLVYTLVKEDGKWKMKFPPTLAQTLNLIETMTRPQ